MHRHKNKGAIFDAFKSNTNLNGHVLHCSQLFHNFSDRHQNFAPEWIESSLISFPRIFHSGSQGSNHSVRGGGHPGQVSSPSKGLITVHITINNLWESCGISSQLFALVL